MMVFNYHIDSTWEKGHHLATEIIMQTVWKWTLWALKWFIKHETPTFQSWDTLI